MLFRLFPIQSKQDLSKIIDKSENKTQEFQSVTFDLTGSANNIKRIANNLRLRLWKR